MSIIMKGLMLTINLEGAIGGCVEHVDKHVSLIRDEATGTSRTYHYLFTPRPIMPAVRVMNISEEVLDAWMSNEPPEGETAFNWRRKTKKQRILWYLSSLDEGFGYSYQIMT